MKLKNTKIPKIIISLGALVVMLAIIQLCLTHYLAGAGSQIASLEKQSAIQEKENQLLVGENEKQLSLEQISVKAQKLGFVVTQNIWFLTSAIPVALK